MNLPKRIFHVTVVVMAVSSMPAQADTTTLSVLQSLTEQDMRRTSGDTSWSADTQQKLNNLQRTEMRNQRELEHYSVHEPVEGNTVSFPQSEHKKSDLPEPLQQHVQHIAEGLMSSDPEQGLRTMIEPVVRQEHDLQLNLGDVKFTTVERQLNMDRVVKIAERIPSE